MTSPLPQERSRILSDETETLAVFGVTFPHHPQRERRRRRRRAAPTASATPPPPRRRHLAHAGLVRISVRRARVAIVPGRRRRRATRTRLRTPAGPLGAGGRRDDMNTTTTTSGRPPPRAGRSDEGRASATGSIFLSSLGGAYYQTFVTNPTRSKVNARYQIATRPRLRSRASSPIEPSSPRARTVPRSPRGRSRFKPSTFFALSSHPALASALTAGGVERRQKRS